MRKVTLVQSDDYRGLYIDGKIVYQYDGFDPYHALELVKDLGPFELEHLYCDTDWLMSLDRLPEQLSDVVLEQ